MSQLPDKSELLSILTNIIKALGPWWGTINLFAYLIGILFVGWGLFYLSRAGGASRQMVTSGQNFIAKFAGAFVAGIFLMNLNNMFDLFSQTLFEQDSQKNLSFSVAAKGPAGTYIEFAVTIVILMGLLGVIKGCILLRYSAEDPKSLWRALTHIVGGVICINILAFIDMLGKTLDGNFETQINLLF
ncbi:MAG: hypothetical protein GY729_19890 [Desulfobacteraceae bacterium]|nr:hypothetical protein [Desulfobacteraceae bacterium]